MQPFIYIIQMYNIGVNGIVGWWKVIFCTNESCKK